jgi:hypothetical protein
MYYKIEISPMRKWNPVQGTWKRRKPLMELEIAAIHLGTLVGILAADGKYYVSKTTQVYEV